VQLTNAGENCDFLAPLQQSARHALNHLKSPTPFWNAVDLERKLELFKDYYNHSRTHASLDGNTPAVISGDRVAQPAPLNSYAWKKHCGGLFQLPVAA
jgi:transposase InsO family protein